MKKFLKVLACAMALTLALGTALAADPIHTTTAVNGVDGGGGETLMFDLLDIDYSKVDKIAVQIDVTSNFANGGIGANTIPDDNAWAQLNFEVTADSAPASGTIVWDNIGGLANVDGDGAGLQIQFWWINPVTDADGNAVEGGTVKVMSVTMYDADGNVLYQAPAAAGSGSTDGGSNNDNAPQTADTMNVALFAGMAAVALAAVVVCAKKKEA